ncbi:FadR/GntR family transcriptional regulator [Streptomyces sp. NPDC057067]|jgi:DNA-binding FadR family transcriptional regulator|uniref:FCD domain-containing protein n=2 Tax=Streptomyces TaxID=1883 RepID=A0ABU8A9D6_9ACTN|nr:MULTISPECIES: FCD domain-containing protein [Streptomyces]WSS71793.1 FCD domain-containing protein [Streptomyces sp. NBC_01175]WSS78799.1 FCD domain-containing protein [Streptomyces sp. NBC_01174]MBL1290876.1 FadR family transcriptional regulator [Streptomyces silvae]MDX3328351.1 FCD domain-containing protein [Streptomyces sp. ME02-6979-3A]MDX3430742.1 FCD domain-containing protein [Streptomyces sp. ME01-18a]
MPLGPLRPSPLVEQATEHLREQITGGSWPVGTKLPGETTLAASLGVGRSTVREALRALAGAGLVQARQGAGVFVIAAEPEEDWATRLRRAAVTDVYEVRISIEVEAARLAARRRTDEDLAALTAALAGRRAAADGGDAAFVDADIALHTAVVAAAHNPVLSALFTEFVPTLRKGLIDMLELLGLRSGDPNHGDESHAALVDAVARGDADAAAHTLREELEQTLTRLTSL